MPHGPAVQKSRAEQVRVRAMRQIRTPGRLHTPLSILPTPSLSVPCFSLLRTGCRPGSSPRIDAGKNPHGRAVDQFSQQQPERWIDSKDAAALLKTRFCSEPELNITGAHQLWRELNDSAAPIPWSLVPVDAILTSEMHGLSLLGFVAVGLLILTNAFFVAAEFALVSIRDTRIEQMLAAGVPGARAVRRLQQQMDDFLPAVQLGVTLCSLALGWIGEPLAASVFTDWMGGLPHARIFAHIAAVTLGFAFITYMEVVVGELVPKSLALRRAEALAVAVAPPMLLFMALARPAVRLLKSSAAALLHGFDVPVTERAQAHSPEELKLIASAARRLGVLPPFQETLIHRALELEDVPIREIMTPRQKIFSLPSNLPIEEASAQVIDHMRSRVPVYDEIRGPEHIVGVVYSKDLARLMFFRPSMQQRGAEQPAEESPAIKKSGFGVPARQTGVTRAMTPEGSFSASLSAWRGRPGSPYVQLQLAQVMRDVLVVPETKTVLDLIREFQQRRRQIAIVVDEYGSTVGLVTAEDAIEQLTGELDDEFDSPALPVLTTAGGALLMDGGVNLRDLETQMQWRLPRDGGVETLAGFVLMRLGHIPREGESVTHAGRRLTVVQMDGRRIARISVVTIEQEQNSRTATDTPDRT
jgi:CBS domain containing-hemolysin-like protein